MEKVKVEICCGTACYLLGAANMMDLEDQLPAEWRGRVEVEARTAPSGMTNSSVKVTSGSATSNPRGRVSTMPIPGTS